MYCKAEGTVPILMPRSGLESDDVVDGGLVGRLQVRAFSEAINDQLFISFLSSFDSTSSMMCGLS